MELDLNMKVSEFVDVYSAVSIGSILACLYAKGVTSDEIIQLFETQGANVFKPVY